MGECRNGRISAYCRIPWDNATKPKNTDWFVVRLLLSLHRTMTNSSKAPTAAAVSAVASAGAASNGTGSAAHPDADTNKPAASSSSSSSGDWSGGAGVLPGRAVVGPLLLMAITPTFAVVFFHVCAHHSGDFIEFGRRALAVAVAREQQHFSSSLDTGGHWSSGIVRMYGLAYYLMQQLYELWPDPWDGVTWQMIGCFCGAQLAFMRWMPGPVFTGNVTPAGHRPVYRANGVATFVVTLATLMVLDVTGLFDLCLVYDKFGNILSTMNVLALVLCSVLLIKGHVAPSGLDSGSTGSWVTDFYWGMELYPRIAGWDVKQFTNCRAGMMFWAVAVLSFCYKNMQLNQGQLQYGLAVSVALQLVYCSKFFYWEMGYMCRCVCCASVEKNV